MYSYSMSLEAAALVSAGRLPTHEWWMVDGEAAPELEFVAVHILAGVSTSVAAYKLLVATCHSNSRTQFPSFMALLVKAFGYRGFQPRPVKLKLQSLNNI